jgi:hypothetical protein
MDSEGEGLPVRNFHEFEIKASNFGGDRWTFEAFVRIGNLPILENKGSSKEGSQTFNDPPLGLLDPGLRRGFIKEIEPSIPASFKLQNGIFENDSLPSDLSDHQGEHLDFQDHPFRLQEIEIRRAVFYPEISKGNADATPEAHPGFAHGHLSAKELGQRILEKAAVRLRVEKMNRCPIRQRSQNEDGEKDPE